MGQVIEASGGEVIDTDHRMPFAQQPVCQVGTKESGGAGYKYAHDRNSCLSVRVTDPVEGTIGNRHKSNPG
jgi:hypothetical protein